MSLKRKFLVSLVVLGASVSAHAQFGGLLGGRSGGGGGDVSGQIEKFNGDSALISKAVAYSLLQIKAALGTKEEAAQVKKVAEDLSKATDAKEAGALQGTVIKTDAARANELLRSADAKDKLQKLQPEVQKKVAQSILSVGIASLKIPGLLDGGKKIIEGVGTNPMMVTRLGGVKDGMSMLADALPKLGPIVSTGLSLMREVKVDPGNPSASAELKPDTSVSVPE